MNILNEANNIVNKRSQEADRQYGPFSEGMEKAAQLATIMSNKNISTIDMFNCMMALKLSRESYSHKTDNLLDLVAYAGGLENYHQQKIIKPKILNNTKYKMYQDLYNAPIITVRGLETKELLNYKLIIKPYDRFFNFKGRNMNLNYIKQEFKWYIKGDKYDTSITQHAKIWKDLINEDGSINSNYGQYINTNLVRCYETLVNDKYSRRAIIMIGNNNNFNSRTKDYCCTLSMSFQIRNNELLMTVHMRSNDAIFGLTNDVPAFSFYHEMLYVLLRDNFYPDLKLGNYTHLVDSFHIYKRHFKMLNNILENAIELKVDCPKIKDAKEVEYLLENKINKNYEFSNWLLK